jgi:4-hydroxybenzoate polyprenyltransferase
MLQTIRHLLSLIRFSHTIFALPFALLAALMAYRMRMLDEIAAHGGKKLYFTVSGKFRFYQLSFSEKGEYEVPLQVRWQELLGILLCMVFARSAAMAFNRLADRTLDATNPRTAGRHLPAGALSTGQVATFAAACGLAFIVGTLMFLPNLLPLYLSVPVLLFLLGYSYAKRFTSLAHFWLGTALALSPIAAWIAIRGEIVLNHPQDLLPAVVLGAAVLTWVAGFDIIYACQDFAYDREAQMRSMPVKLGVAGALRLAAACHFATIVLLACLPLVYPPLGGLWWAGVAVVAGLLIYEHALVRPNDLARVNTAFFNVNAVISLGLMLVGGFDLLLN